MGPRRLWAVSRNDVEARLSIVTILRDACRRLQRRKAISRVIHISSMSQLPKRLGAAAFVVEKAGTPRWVVLECPCRCGARIDVNLMKTARPHWNLSFECERITISPSLWQPRERCGSHVLVRQNKIRWV